MDDEPTPTPPKRGRPATGHDPVRTVRVGPIWDEARDIAKARGESLAAVITADLTRYVARHKRSGGRGLTGDLVILDEARELDPK